MVNRHDDSWAVYSHSTSTIKSKELQQFTAILGEGVGEQSPPWWGELGALHVKIGCESAFKPS